MTEMRRRMARALRRLAARLHPGVGLTYAELKALWDKAGFDEPT